MAKNSTRGSNAQFTYDFGIAIAQSTITKLTRLTGVTISLASEYVDTYKNASGWYNYSSKIYAIPEQ